tara:strand:- start:486 stop:1007 length:522 start_codon:yes stop_codon:yes gene_type:complete
MIPLKIKKIVKTTLYRHFDIDKKLLYVGVSLSWSKRLKQHRISYWHDKIHTVTLEQYESREKAIQAERQAILKENPIYNIQRYKNMKEERKLSKQILEKSVSRFVGNFVNFKLSYSLKEVKEMTGLRMKDIEWYIEKNILSYYETTYRDGCIPKKRITGWCVIDLLENLIYKK